MDLSNAILWLRNATSGALTPVSSSAPIPTQDSAAETSLSGLWAATGTAADAAYTGTGPATVVSVLKGLYTLLASGAASVVASGATVVLGAGSALIGKVLALPSNAAVTYTNPTVSATAEPIVAAGAATVFLDIQNLSDTLNVTLYSGTTIIRVLTPLATFTREGSNIPSNAISASAAGGSAAVSVGIA